MKTCARICILNQPNPPSLADLEVGENGPDVLLKAHVNHPVSLVQRQVAADVQADHLLLQQVH